MRAVVMDSGGAVRVADLPDPELPGPTGVVVGVDAAAICGSDLHFYDGDLPVWTGFRSDTKRSEESSKLEAP